MSVPGQDATTLPELQTLPGYPKPFPSTRPTSSLKRFPRKQAHGREAEEREDAEVSHFCEESPGAYILHPLRFSVSTLYVLLVMQVFFYTRYIRGAWILLHMAA